MHKEDGASEGHKAKRKGKTVDVVPKEEVKTSVTHPHWHPAAGTSNLENESESENEDLVDPDESHLLENTFNEAVNNAKQGQCSYAFRKQARAIFADVWRLVKLDTDGDEDEKTNLAVINDSVKTFLDGCIASIHPALPRMVRGRYLHRATIRPQGIL
jgi:hypothetical protein